MAPVHWSSNAFSAISSSAAMYSPSLSAPRMSRMVGCRRGACVRVSDVEGWAGIAWQWCACDQSGRSSTHAAPRPVPGTGTHAQQRSARTGTGRAQSSAAALQSRRPQSRRPAAAAGMSHRYVALPLQLLHRLNQLDHLLVGAAPAQAQHVAELRVVALGLRGRSGAGGREGRRRRAWAAGGGQTGSAGRAAHT